MKTALQVLAGLVAAFLAWALFRTPSPEERERAILRHAIEECWKEQASKSLEPATARFIAGACERLEEDLRRHQQLNP